MMLSMRIWLIAGLVFVLSVSGSYFAGRHEGRKVERAAQAVALNKALLQQRAEFQEKTDAQAKIAEEARKRQEDLERDNWAASAAADGMRRARDAAVSAARKCAAASGAGAPTWDAAGMLGRVLEECNSRYAAVAKYADAARIAGSACQQSYDTLREQKP